VTQGWVTFATAAFSPASIAVHGLCQRSAGARVP
jgi:hypothetical protein